MERAGDAALTDIGAVQADRVLDLLRDAVRIGRRQIDLTHERGERQRLSFRKTQKAERRDRETHLVQDRDDLQVVLQGEVDVRQRLEEEARGGTAKGDAA